MKKQNLVVLGIIAALIVVVFALAVFLPKTREIPQSAPAVPTAEATATAAPAEETAMPAATATDTDAAQAKEVAPAEAYLLISVGGELYAPLPLLDEGAFTIRQSDTVSNKVHITRDSVWMEHSTCDNQDCVEQGVVSLENMKDRVLYNMVICLPNQVALELHTLETLESTYGWKPQD